MDAKIQYLRILVRGEALLQFDVLYADVENIETLNVDYYIKGLEFFFSLWIRFQNKSAQCAAEWKNTQSKSKTLCRTLD